MRLPTFKGGLNGFLETVSMPEMQQCFEQSTPSLRTELLSRGSDPVRAKAQVV